MVRKLGIKTPFKNGVPGKDWVAGFLKRHEDVRLRTPQALSTVRAKMLNETVTNNYFNDLISLMQQLHLTDKPSCIWNIDETGVPLLHKPARVLAQKGIKNLPGRVGNNRDNISVLACVNAAGGEIPPMVIIKGKTYKSLMAYNTEEGVPGSIYTYQERAWMEDALGEIWFKGHFLQHCGPERPQLIVLDSHSSHETLGFLEAAIENNISVMAFPPHTTQWLCPLDKTIFGPLSRAYSRECTEFMASSPNNIVNKWEWPRLFKQAHDQAFTTSNIVSGFRKCGIFPPDRSTIPTTALMPSQPFDICLSPTESKSPEVPMSEVNTSITTCTSSLVNSNPVIVHTSAQVGSSSNVTGGSLPDVSSLVVSSPSTEGCLEAMQISEQELINMVISGQYPCTVNSTTGDLEVQLEVPLQDTGNISPNSVLSPPSMEVLASLIQSCPEARKPSVKEWSDIVETTFQLPMSDRKVSPKPNVRKLTSHRVLTSTEIVTMKREVNEKKEKMKAEKEERKNVRMLKKEKTNSKCKVKTE